MATKEVKKTKVLSDDEILTIPSAFECIYTQVKKYGLGDKLWKKIKIQMDFLVDKLELTKMQVLFLSSMIEDGTGHSWEDFACYLGCMRIRMMSYAYEMDDLVRKGWLIVSRNHRSIIEYGLVDGVAETLCCNKVFIPEMMGGLSLSKFVKKLIKHIGTFMSGNSFQDFEQLMKMLKFLIENNMHLPICQFASKLNPNYEMFVFLLCVVEHVRFSGHPEEGITINVLEDVFNNAPMIDLEDLRNGSNILLVSGNIEHKCIGGMADNNRLVLTKKAKINLLSGLCLKNQKTNLNNFKDITQAKNIAKKELFYTEEDKKQIDMLRDLLGKDRLTEVQTRLTEMGMRKGFACLFYGAPGTGKTETVLQLARESGRDIMVVDIAGLRDKYVGESENNIKEIFKRYRSLCEQSKTTPILFFNEADGILGKRTEIGDKNSSVEKMDNAMQNIILQEMETLDGILIATTNLTCNLDDAFERRFIFKIEFHKPDVEAKAKIWQSMIKDLSEDDALHLASEYDFSGGQIENIARKQAINYVLTGHNSDLDELRQFCDQERLGMKGGGNKPMKVLGFAS